MYSRYIKRLLDVVLSVIGLIALSPFFLFVIIWIHMDSKGSALFKQKRYGRNEQLFTIYKFRTMRTDAPKNMPTHKFEGAEKYITRSGAFLRRTSIDELAQLYNVLRGDMSLVGPRPALWNQQDLVAERNKYGANAVRPGLTGWAQVNGRDELPIRIKAKFDGDYVRHITFSMDLRCLIRTVFAVARQDGVVEGARKRPDMPTQDDQEDHLGNGLPISAAKRAVSRSA